MNKKIIFLSAFLSIFIFAVPVYAALSSAGFLPKAQTWIDSKCFRPNINELTRQDSLLCYLFAKTGELEATNATQSAQIANLENKPGKHVFDVQQVRGSGLDIEAPLNPIKTPGELTVNCPTACLLWVSYDVDTRNTQIPSPGQWYQHLYHIFIDDIDQAVYNQVSATVPNAAYPVAVNGVIPVSAGQHTVSIWVKVTGGHLQQFTSHLQVMAIEQ